MTDDELNNKNLPLISARLAIANYATLYLILQNQKTILSLLKNDEMKGFNDDMKRQWEETNKWIRGAIEKDSPDLEGIPFFMPN